MPRGKVPLLVVDGVGTLSQSVAIARFFAEKHQLAGKGEWERAKVHELEHTHQDFFRTLIQWVLHKSGIKPVKEPVCMNVALGSVADFRILLTADLFRKHSTTRSSSRSSDAFCPSTSSSFASQIAATLSPQA